MSDRLEARTLSTRDCPDEPHDHLWVKRKTADRFAYRVEADGTVVVSEEALAMLLRQAGCVPA